MIPLINDHRDELAECCRKYGVLRLEVFGSAAEADVDADARDVDLLVEFAHDRDLGPWMRDYFALRDELAVVLGRSVDLVMAGGMRNAYFIGEVNRTRKLLYAA